MKLAGPVQLHTEPLYSPEQTVSMHSRATVNGGNGNGNGNGNRKGSSQLRATLVVQVKTVEIYGWYGP